MTLSTLQPATETRPDPPASVNQRIIERNDQWQDDIAIDHENSFVRNVVLTSSESRNGYQYDPQALRDATPLYEDKPVFLDHAGDPSRPKNRSTRDLVGSIVNARFVNGKIRGDIRVLKTDSGRIFFELAESDASHVGMSHVVLAHRSADGSRVDKINDVISVDVVVHPATTRTFSESTDVETLTDCLESVTAERDRLRKSLSQAQDALARLQRERDIDEALRDSELPAEAITETFRLQLLAEADPGRRHSLIQDRLELVQHSMPRTSSMPRQQRLPSLNHSFIAAIKGLDR